MLAVKTVRQRYNSTEELLSSLEQFRRMLNDCIKIGLAENVTSLKALSSKVYHQLSGYNIMSYYKLCAISRASGIRIYMFNLLKSLYDISVGARADQ